MVNVAPVKVSALASMNKPNLACGPNLNFLGNTIGQLHVRSALISLPFERDQKIAVRCGFYWRAIREVDKTLLNSRPVQELSPIMLHGGAEACASLSFHYLDHLCPACLQGVVHSLSFVAPKDDPSAQHDTIATRSLWSLSPTFPVSFRKYPRGSGFPTASWVRRHRHYFPRRMFHTTPTLSQQPLGDNLGDPVF